MISSRELKPYLPYGVVFAMLTVATLLFSRIPGEVKMMAPAVSDQLPARVGDWVGEDLSYCQNEKCMRAVLTAELAGTNLCPECGGPMSASWSLGERRLLPADTVLVRKRYRHPYKPSFDVTVVISSSEEVSIHRPEMCLTGQGYDIAGEAVRQVPVAGRSPLEVRVMSIFRRYQAADGRMKEQPGYFAFWFLSRDHETASSARRILLATWDRVIHGHVSRWAYISVAGIRPGSPESMDDALDEFIGTLYPLVAEGKGGGAKPCVSLP